MQDDVNGLKLLASGLEIRSMFFLAALTGAMESLGRHLPPSVSADMLESIEAGLQEVDDGFSDIPTSTAHDAVLSEFRNKLRAALTR